MRVIGYYVRDNALNREYFPKQVGAVLRKKPQPGGPFTNPVIRCGCGSTQPIICDAFTNSCDDCSADYDSNATRLAPREQWGEETGEHWSECY